MTDDELSCHIDDCTDNGYATQEEIAKLFKLRPYIIEKRVNEGERFLQTKWHSLVESMSKNYPSILPSDIKVIKKDNDGNEKDIGVGVQTRELARRGLDRRQICELLKMNPDVWNKYPIMDILFREGEAEARQAHIEQIERVLKSELIDNKWFENKGLPTWKKLAEGYTVTLVKEEYQVKQGEDGKNIRKLVKVTKQDKYIEPDKEALNKLTKISGTGLLDSSLARPSEIEAGAELQQLPDNTFDENGRYIVKDTEYEVIEDDK